jgi:phospholipase/carboxylesterase
MSQLDAIELSTGPNPKASIVVLHGLGADGNDFVPIAQELQLGAVGDVRFVFPHAPTMPVTINGGMVMRAWYDIVGADLVRREDEAGLRRSMALVESLLERERERGMPSERTVLMGFSQGCALTLLTGLRHAHRLAGLVGLSGYLPLAATTADERSAANAATPVFLGHGQYDGVVPVARAAASRELLESLGQPVEWHEYPIQHSVSMDEIVDLNRWLLRVLG